MTRISKLYEKLGTLVAEPKHNIIKFLAMKNLIFLLLGITGSIAMLGQVPNSFSYQAVIRNSDGTVKQDESVYIHIEIFQGNIDGASEYIEIHNTTTNSFGLVTLEIGKGISPDDFALIDWSKGQYFIEVKVNGISMGTSQLLSVPFALQAGSVDNVDDADADPENEIQTLSISDHTISLSVGGGNVTVPDNFEDADADPGNELQNLNNVLLLGNSANNQIIKDLSTPVDDQDAVTKKYVDELIKKIEYLERISGMDTLSDVNGNVYKTIKIGKRVWMVENLRTTKYNHGSPIPLVTDDFEWAHLSTPGYCWEKNDSSTYAQTYGALYNWYTVNTGNLCPVGWHVPTDTEWIALLNQLGGQHLAGGKLKETGTAHWNSPNIGATNETGFTALPGGMRSMYDGYFTAVGAYGCWWSATEHVSISGNAWYMFITNSESQGSMDWSMDNKRAGYSVRCVKDEISPPQIIQQPSSLSKIEGDTAVFIFEVIGNPLNYKWYKDGVGLIEGDRIQGSTSDTLKIFDLILSDAGEYECKVSNDSGMVSSNIVYLDITPEP